ncbi:putative alkaline shock family protein YloU [Glaciihabitans tibetensis]|uniref:Putative alkaline shock family protein YloU n=1 Tax=Glaciihabitans tibetensis TaxID=1266600 RepID=A0A2T0V3G2_9MICO|nr:Asp23/Gls24 family envelope stress response protein [Glaciihabitans tibetensis]PRY64694.1 putative alkaline shock family protein YloU [Glaciihabitans tibetensis]
MVNATTPTSTLATSPTGAGAGKTTIDTGVIAKVAGIATTSVPGVHAVGGGMSRALGAIRGAMNQADLGQGVSVEVGERQVAVDITLVAEYPMPLQKVADGVRAAVYTAIEGIVGMDVAEVNVTINDVYIPGQEEPADDETTKAVRVQ